MALVECYLLQPGTITADDMQVERLLIAIFVHCAEAALAFVEQYRSRPHLPGRREDDPAIRQVLRHDVVTNFGRQIRWNHAPENVVFECVFPEVPGWLVCIIEVGIERAAHGEEHRAAIIGDLHIPHRALVANHALRDVDRLGTR